MPSVRRRNYCRVELRLELRSNEAVFWELFCRFLWNLPSALPPLFLSLQWIGFFSNFELQFRSSARQNSSFHFREWRHKKKIWEDEAEERKEIRNEKKKDNDDFQKKWWGAINQNLWFGQVENQQRMCFLANNTKNCEKPNSRNYYNTRCPI